MIDNKDFLVRGVIKNLNIRFSLIDTTTAVNNGIILHSCSPVSAALFGKALTIAGLISPLLDKGEKYSIKWEYSGPASTILIDVDDKCKLRGIPGNPLLDNEATTENTLYGDTGRITVMKFKESKILNSGIAETAMMEIADDISYYMSTSDQIETDFYAAFKFNATPAEPVKSFNGFMIQEMPDCNLLEFDKFRQKLRTSQTIDILTDTSLSYRDKTEKIFEYLIDSSTSLNENFNLAFEKSAIPVYSCGCSFEKMKNAVLTLKKGEIMNIIQKEGAVKTSCKFCKKTYPFKEHDFDFLKQN